MEMKSQNMAQSTHEIFDPFIAERRSLGIEYCPICQDTGVEQYIEDGIKRGKPCECMREYYNRRRIKISGLEPIVNEKTFDSYTTDESWQSSIKRIAKKFIYTPNTWFFIGGAVGSGKTHICTAICGILIKSKQVRYAAWREHITPIKAAVLDEDRYRKLIEPLKTADVLYIDDFFKTGGGKITEADINVAFTLLDYRYTHKLTTIISTEYFMDTLMKIDNAIATRIYEMSSEFCIQICDNDGSKNYRLKIRNNKLIETKSIN